MDTTTTKIYTITHRKYDRQGKYFYGATTTVEIEAISEKAAERKLYSYYGGITQCSFRIETVTLKNANANATN